MVLTPWRQAIFVVIDTSLGDIGLLNLLSIAIVIIQYKKLVNYKDSEYFGNADRIDTLIEWINKVGRKADSFTHGVREHVRLGPKVSTTLKGKLRLATRVLQEGGVEKLFKQIFNVREGEKLLNASQCYLSTTAGPIAGLLFISNENVAFYSERYLRFTLPTQELIRIPYKVMIPLQKIKGANRSENVKNPNQKYILVTVDKFEFWFMGFLKYQKAFKYIHQAISQS
ncbi:putative GEM-like protein 8 [Macadamia integrifolia]|uniref:putative GEM-like protein 8 n=1 Tax=Macadamia integrifolia TaxID=60698 RepID=UPI001C4EC96C|nr:putative GEM-like protein 8 [Macadamia integrifolia]